MEKQVLPTSEAPHINIRVDGELEIKGSDELEVVAKSDSSNNLSLDQNRDVITMNCQSNCSIRVPRDSVLLIETCSGNAAVKALDGSLNIQKVDGNLYLRNVGTVHLDGVSGNLLVKHVDGDLSLRVVEGNADVRDVQGDFIVTGGIQGNLSLDEVEGNASARTDGNISLRLDPLPGQTYEFSSGGNIVCRLPSDVSAVVKINKASKARIHLGNFSQPVGDKFPSTITLGDGDASLIFGADGNLDLVGRAPDWEMPEVEGSRESRSFEGIDEDIAAQFEKQISAQMDLMESQLNAQLDNISQAFRTAGISEERMERTRQAAARATARAREKMQRAQEKIQRKIEFAQRRAGQHARPAERYAQSYDKRSMGFEWPGPKPEASSEPVSDEERMMILKMLEEKKITPEEADTLLAALEGKSTEE